MIDPSPEAVAAAFVAARRARTGLAAFPGAYPADVAAAYAIQRAATALWEAPVAGWKVGRLGPDLAAQEGQIRFLGPVFAGTVAHAAPGQPIDFPAFPGGSAAFEAEYAVVLGADQPDDWTDPAPEDVRALVGAVHFGVEVAGSPLATMAECDARASIADMGNNAGMILGGAVPVAALDDPAGLRCATRIDGVLVREAGADALPGGPLAALAFACAQAARLGFRLRAGEFVSTGAVTGVHRVAIGQSCSATFGSHGRIDCAVVAMAPA